MEGIKDYQASSRYGGVSRIYQCPICEKNFLVPFQTKGGGRTDWVYKMRKDRKRIYLCSYHCFTQAKKQEKEEVSEK